METTLAPPLPLVANLSKEQRNALLVDLIKAHFAEVGMPWFLTVRDGDALLGVFHPEFPRPEKSTIPDFPPEFIDEMKHWHKELAAGRAELLTSEEFQALMEKDLDGPHGK